MSTIKHITTLVHNGKEYKKERIQRYDSNSYKSTNKFFIDGKLATKFLRYQVESILLDHSSETKDEEINY